MVLRLKYGGNIFYLSLNHFTVVVVGYFDWQNSRFHKMMNKLAQLLHVDFLHAASYSTPTAPIAGGTRTPPSIGLAQKLLKAITPAPHKARGTVLSPAMGMHHFAVVDIVEFGSDLLQELKVFADLAATSSILEVCHMSHQTALCRAVFLGTIFHGNRSSGWPLGQSLF